MAALKAARTATPWIVSVAFAAFMVPQLVFAFTSGSYAAYRVSQVVALALLAIAAVMGSREARGPSWQGLVMVAVIGVSTLAAVMHDAFAGRQLDHALLMKAGMLTGFVLLLDRLRGYGLTSFARSMLPVSVVLILATTIHFAANPVIVWERYMFFGLHPNIGGEALLGCMITVVFCRSRAIRLGLGSLIIILLVLLQSRAALGGSLIILVGTEALRLVVGKNVQAVFSSLGVAMLASGGLGAILVLAMPDAPSQAASFVANKMFLFDNPYRGLGTGLVNRDTTWGLGLTAFAENPVFGVGMDRIGRTSDGLAVHNGYLMALGQFGMLSLGLWFVLVSGVLRGLKHRSASVVIIAACLFVFFFNPRSINLNVFPLLMWVICLPWAPSILVPTKASSKEMALK